MKKRREGEEERRRRSGGERGGEEGEKEWKGRRRKGEEEGRVTIFPPLHTVRYLTLTGYQHSPGNGGHPSNIENGPF